MARSDALLRDRAAVERPALKSWQQGGMCRRFQYRASPGRYSRRDVTTATPWADGNARCGRRHRALRADPDFADAPRALVMIGFASLRLGLAPEAGTAFRRALERDPHGRYARVAQLGRAAALRERHRWDEARTALASLAEPPAGLRCEVLAERAALARATGRHDEDAPTDTRMPPVPSVRRAAGDNAHASSRCPWHRASQCAARVARRGARRRGTPIRYARRLARDNDLVAARRIRRALDRVGPAARSLRAASRGSTRW
jgi:hypothetical protein